MRMIKRISGEIRKNISEARDKICTAYKLRDKDKAAADWYKEMAAAHIKFNDAGHANVARMISEAKQKMASDPMLPGMMVVYEDMHADIMKESAEVSAMIATFK